MNGSEHTVGGVGYAGEVNCENHLITLIEKKLNAINPYINYLPVKTLIQNKSSTVQYENHQIIYTEQIEFATLQTSCNVLFVLALASFRSLESSIW